MNMHELWAGHLRGTGGVESFGCDAGCLLPTNGGSLQWHFVDQELNWKERRIGKMDILTLKLKTFLFLHIYVKYADSSAYQRIKLFTDVKLLLGPKVHLINQSLLYSSEWKCVSERLDFFLCCILNPVATLCVSLLLTACVKAERSTP